MLSDAVRDIFIASILADVSRKAALHPIDSLTTRLQYDRGSDDRKKARVPLISDVQSICNIVRSPGGAASLYRGFGTSLVGAVPVALVYMPTYELSSAAVSGLSGTLSLPLPASQLASICTGCACALVRVPLGLIKSRLQLGLFATPQLAIAAALQAGWTQLFVGLRATIVLDVLYALVQFTVLERLRVLGSILSGGRVLTAGEDVIIGFLTGAITAIATEPLDVVRTRLQNQKRREAAVGGTDFGYTGVLDGLRKASQEEGIGVLWRGLLPRLVLKSTGSSIWYAVYWFARRALAAGA